MTPEYSYTDSMVNTLPVPAYIFQMDTHRIIAANKRFADLLEYSQEELLQLTLEEIRPPEDIQLLQKALESEPPEGTVEWRYKTRAGHILFVRVRYRNMIYTHQDKRLHTRFVVADSFDELPTTAADKLFGE